MQTILYINYQSCCLAWGKKGMEVGLEVGREGGERRQSFKKEKITLIGQYNCWRA